MTTPAAVKKDDVTDFIAQVTTPEPTPLPTEAPAKPVVEAPADEHTPHDDELANHFADLDEEFEGEEKAPSPAVEPKKDEPVPASVQQPPAPAATPSAPAVPLENKLEPVPTAPQPAEPPKSEQRQPESPEGLPPELDLFGDMAQPPQQSAPVQQPVAQQPPTAPAPTQPAPTTQPLTLQEQQEAAKQNDYAKLRDGYISELEQVYQLDEATARDLVVEPEKVIPKLFARMHADMVASVAQGVVQQIPQMIALANRQQQARQEFNREFARAWPQLARKENLPAIQQTMRTYRQMNPQAPMDQTIRDVGALVSMQLRIPPPGMVPQQPQQQQGMPPIAPHTAPRVTPTGPQKNEWGSLNDDWDREDID